MKKFLCFLFGITTVMTLTGCNILKPGNNTPSPASSSTPGPTSTASNSGAVYHIKDYYPFKSNIKYTYEGKGNEYASYTVYVDYLTDSREQIRINNGGTETVKVLESKDGELRVGFLRAETYYRENLTGKNNDKADILLKEPLKRGTSWVLSDGSTRSITNTDVAISTPSGNYKCIEVTTPGKESTNKDYYALNAGLVKSVFIAGNGGTDSEISSTLSKAEPNVPFVQTVKFYYPNAADDVNYSIERKLSFNTNDITKEVFRKYFKEPVNNSGKLISENTRINYLYLNADGMVYVDFSKEFVTEMNAGSGYEGMILQCVTNTLGDYYGAGKVYITLEGKPYSSGHFQMKEGEAFTVHPKDEAKIIVIK
jgi:hypothetical protein